MDEAEFNRRLGLMNLTIEEYDDVMQGKCIRFRHPLLGVVDRVHYSQRAIDDLKEIHGLDASSETWTAVIEMLEASVDLKACQIIQAGDASEFFEQFSFAYLERLADKYSNIAKIVANPKWK